MDLTRALELLKIERECVKRQNNYCGSTMSDKCSRTWVGNCSECDLVQSDVDVLNMYDTVIALVTNYVDAKASVNEWTKCLTEEENE